MFSSRKNNSGSLVTRTLVTVSAALLAGLCTVTAQAFPSLNLVPGTPDIVSSFINVDYIGDNTGGSLFATGFANVLTPPGSPDGNIAGGSFDINSTVDFNAQTASGALTIGGTVASEGFNSGTLLTGTFTSTAGNQTFGAGAGDPLEFLFTVTGGDAASLYGGVGSQAGVILANSGYSGSFDASFSSAPFAALADTFGTASSVPVPGTLVLMVFGGGLLLLRRRQDSRTV